MDKLTVLFGRLMASCGARHLGEINEVLASRWYAWAYRVHGWKPRY